MINYLQLPFQFDPAFLKQDVQQFNSAGWKLHFQKLHYEGDWSAIALRSINGDAGNIIPAALDEKTFGDTVFLAGCHYIRSLLGTFQCPLKNVRLMKLNAGAVIKEHRDVELSYEHGEIRLHIPVITHKDVEFYLDNERVHLKEGECWYLNFNLPHRISNNSNIDRIHLVIDAVVNDWVHETFSNKNLLRKEAEEPLPYQDNATKVDMIKLFRLMNTDTSNKMADDLESGMKTS